MTDRHLEKPVAHEVATHSHLAQLHSGATLVEVRNGSRLTNTADLPPLHITGVNEQGEQPASRAASAAAKESASGLDRAAQEFGQAQTPEQQARALEQLHNIVRDADKSGQTLQTAMNREADALVPGMSQAGRDVLKAGDRLKDQVNKLNEEQISKIIPQINQWSTSGTSEREKIEQTLRAAGLNGVADAMKNLGGVQHDHAEQFKNGEKVEDQLTRHFGPGQRDSLKTRTDARAIYAEALRMAHRGGEADTIENEINHLH
jgi:hypothetical protein